MVGVILICAHRVFRVPEDLLTECARAHPEACKTDKTPCLTVVCLASCAVSRRGYDCSLLWDNVDKGFETNTPISWIISSFKEDARFGATTQSILSHESPESHSLWRQFVVIGIAQFSGNLYEFCCKDADDDGKTVIIAVIDGDYLRCYLTLLLQIFNIFLSSSFNDPFLVKCRRSFGDVLEFLPIADSVTKLTARCEVCGQKGFFTVRRTCDTRTELIGGADVYIPVCLKHYYINNQIVIKEVLDSDKARTDTCVETVAAMF
ncbi:hypothetical protein Bca52824_017527 [Brassica carinata]|uniref:Thymidine kinase n=1 Tax=Brassica carinata TaxID=52824 RepID=A0A8X7VN98_BRACI|nr:hypothetical protein Bca52824_017527 [Brassica carinata]